MAEDEVPPVLPLTAGFWTISPKVGVGYWHVFGDDSRFCSDRQIRQSKILEPAGANLGYKSTVIERSIMFPKEGAMRELTLEELDQVSGGLVWIDNRNGIDGANGTDGADGADGANGADGADGVSVDGGTGANRVSRGISRPRVDRIRALLSSRRFISYRRRLNA
jgi:hypothetical protein